MALKFARIEDGLISLGKRIERGDALAHPAQSQIPEWQGADTVVTSSFENGPEDHDLIVRTVHAKQLTWLFFELRDCFSNELNAGNKYGFYGRLAQAALDHLSANQPEPEEAGPLLKAVLKEAFRFLLELRESDELPPDSGVVIHSIDKEGRQKRSDSQ